MTMGTLLIPMLAAALQPTARDIPAGRRCYQVRQAERPPRIDGVLDEACWQQTEATSGLTQQFPDPGKPASFHTRIRVLHDERALYVAARCRDPHPGQIVARVTRRDRWIESDWFQVEIDSRRDGRTGYFFAVNPAGVKLDGVLFDENQENTDWDGVWDAAARVTDDGWNLEMRIPLALLRFQAGAQVGFGINFQRRISRLNEVDQWQFIDPGSGLRVSRFGLIEGLDLPDRPVRMEVTPYMAARRGTGGGEAAGPGRPLEVGADARMGLGSSFMLTMTANPDFGQVEVDQVVLNLSTIETYHPEKRPFFLEDMSLFQTPRFGDGGPRAELFYTRRIGRAPRDPDLDDDEEVMRAARLPRIYGAAKLAGRTEGRLSVGVLQAVTSREEARVLGPDGEVTGRPAEPMTSASILRLEQGFWDNSSAGVTGTALVTPDDGSALTAGADVQLELFDGSFNLTAITLCSYLTEERFGWHDDFTRTALEGEGPFGYSGELVLWKKSGEHLVGAVGGSYRSPSLALNDVGYLDRSDLAFAWGWLQFRHLKPLGPVARIQINANAWLLKNTDLLNIGDGFNLNGTITFKNNWYAGGYFVMNPARCDDRETRTAGAVVLCTGKSRLGGGAWVQTDERQPVHAGAEIYGNTTEMGHDVNLSLSLGVDPVSRMQLELIPRYRHATGSVHWIDSRTMSEGDQTLFAIRHTETWDLTLRGTFTFTTELTLQAYGQVFLASVDHGRKLAAPVPGARRVGTGTLVPAADVADEYDFTSSTLNIGVVLRWEYLPGSVAYLVYTGAIGEQLDGPDFRFGRVLGDLFSAPADHTLMLKLSYLWG